MFQGQDGEPTTQCERWGFPIPKPMSELAEPSRRIYPDEASERGLSTSLFDHGYANFLHCIESNCGERESTYCIVLANGYVDNCVAWNGYVTDIFLGEYAIGLEEAGLLPASEMVPQYPIGTRIFELKTGTAEEFWASPGFWVIEPSQLA
jgi:hypothetical protein